ncbi:peptidoglycan-binding protein [Roseobacter sp.]|uniref:peptidoglycan-binding domain-containing protein n=1 Tax=Roseobacter sp. TaxID=1907202 RepID=UPI003297F3DD
MTRGAFLRCVMQVFCVAALGLGTPVGAQTRIVGMVVSSGSETARADQVLQSLTALDAEILQASDPSNAQLRAMMRRFAQEASQADAAIVFLDMPAVTVGDRLFALPRDTRLTRASDIFTQAVPLRAFARMTVLAERGGAVILSVGTPPEDLSPDMNAATTAPAPLGGVSEILVVPALAAGGVLDIFARETTGPRVDLSTVLARMAAVPGATLSGTPAAPIILRAPKALPPVVLPQVVAGPEATPPASTEELAVLEQSLSPPVRRDLQRALRAQGHYKGLIDGIMGVQTRAAIRGFQETRTEADTGLLTPRQLLELLAQG